MRILIFALLLTGMLISPYLIGLFILGSEHFFLLWGFGFLIGGATAGIISIIWVLSGMLYFYLVRK